jgi:methyltransferase (TIGR00027 family)
MDSRRRRFYRRAMEAGQPSRTALGAAGHRAAHQALEGGRIFTDPLALRILGPDADAAVDEARNNPARRAMRMFIAARTRFAEDSARSAIARGVRQVVVLGAGLDTFAYRAPAVEGLRVFEVDHPATQAWKRARLAAAGIPLPPSVAYAAADFERTGLSEGLARAGFDPNARSFVTWLGVTPYLTESAVYATLGFIGGLPGGEVVFDYASPTSSIADGAARAFREELIARVAAAGEAFKSFYETPALHARLRAIGFREIEDLGSRDIAARYFPDRAHAARNGGGHILRAAVG